MRGKATARYALFLVLLVLGQEFSVARYIHAPVGGNHRELKQGYGDPEHERGLARHHTRAVRRRRSLGLVLLGVALGFSLAELGFELYLKLNTCCTKIANPKLCEYAETYKTQKALLEQNNKDVDAKVLEAQHLLTDIELGNGQFQTVGQKIYNIMTQQEELLTAIRPEVVKDFQTKMSAILAAARAKNETVNQFTIDELHTEFQSVFNSFEGTMMAMGGIFATMIQGGVTLAFKQYRINKINQNLADWGNPNSANYKLLVNARHTKAAKVMGVDRVGVNKFIDTARQNKIEAKIKNTDGSTGKYATGLKYAGWAISGVIVLASGALTVYNIMQKFEQCQLYEDNARVASTNITLANQELTELKTNVTNYVVFLDKVGADYITGELRNDSLLETLNDIQTLLEGASSQSQNNKNAAALIKEYITKIKTATLAESYDLVTKLIDGLSQVEYIYKCYTNKVQLYNYIVRECKAGNKDLPDIWTAGSASWSTEEQECLSKTNMTYYSLADATDAMKITAANEGFNFDCKLNSADYKREACSLVNKDGMTADEASKKMNGKLTPAQVTAITAKDCPLPDITPAEGNMICNLRTQNWTAAMIKSMILPHLSEDQITNHICP